MFILDSIIIALKSIKVHKLRSILTVLGVVIGVSSIVIIVGLGQLAERELKNSIVGENGDSTITLNYIQNAPLTYTTPEIPSLSSEAIIHLNNMDNVNKVKLDRQTIIEMENREGEEHSIFIIGFEENEQVVTASMIEGNEPHLDNGLGFNDVIINDTFIKNFLYEKSNTEVIGEIIDVQKQPFRIVNTYSDRYEQTEFETSEMLIGAEVWDQLFNNNTLNVEVEVQNVELLDQTSIEIINFLNQLSIDQGLNGEFEVLNLEEIEEAISQISNIMIYLIGAIASIALVVGGIGIMNIMLVSVTERTKEIGIRKANGATDYKILIQFLIESIILTFSGGLMGVLVAYLILFLITFFLGVGFVFSLPVVLLSLLFSILTGIIFGILPAKKASELDPIKALNYE
ncbi:ABC transporter permease [Bacillus sp. A116_S68]|nr:ABC transporter permease [Bacillus sp. A116_S68]